MSRPLRAVILAAVRSVPLVLLASGAQAQPQGATVRVDVNLVTLEVHVMDRTGRAVSGLDRSDFSVYEDGVLQQISHFSSDEQPITIGLVLDKSGSMAEMKKIVGVRFAALDLVNACRAGTEISCIFFDDRITIPVDLTTDPLELKAALAGLRKAGGQTSLYDAMLAGLAHLRRGRHPRKALVVMTDGADNSSRNTLEELLAALQETRAQVYMLPFEDHPVFARLAAESGGLVLAGDTHAAIHAITTDLRTAYTLGYYPSQPDGRPCRLLKVRVRGPRLAVRAPRGYCLQKDEARPARQGVALADREP